MALLTAASVVLLGGSPAPLGAVVSRPAASSDTGDMTQTPSTVGSISAADAGSKASAAATTVAPRQAGISATPALTAATYAGNLKTRHGVGHGKATPATLPALGSSSGPFPGVVNKPAPPSSSTTSAATVIHYYPTATSRGTGHHNATSAPQPRIFGSGPMQFQGGYVQHSPRALLVFWGDWGANDTDQIAPYLTNFFTGIGGTAWLEAQTQYAGTNGVATNPVGQLGGTWFDSSTPPSSAPPLGQTLRVISDTDLTAEAYKARAHFAGIYRALDDNIFVVTPRGYGSKGFESGNYCAWHTVAYDGTWMPYTNMPYLTSVNGCGTNFLGQSKLDGVSMVAGHEYAETMTDPATAFLGSVSQQGWFDPTGGSAYENGDKCAWVTGGFSGAKVISTSTGPFAVQSLWSNAVNDCTTTSATWKDLGGPGVANAWLFGESCPANADGRVGYCYVAGSLADPITGIANTGVIYQSPVTQFTGVVGSWNLVYTWTTGPGNLAPESNDGISCVDTGTGANHNMYCYVAQSLGMILACRASASCGLGSWSAAAVPGATYLYGISCTSKDLCALAGASAGNKAWLTHTGNASAASPTWTVAGDTIASTNQPATPQSLLAVDCVYIGPASASCYEGGMDGRVLRADITTAPGAATWTFSPAPASSVGPVDSITCFSANTDATKCYAGADQGVQYSLAATDSTQAWQITSMAAPAGTALGLGIGCSLNDCSETGTDGRAASAGLSYPWAADTSTTANELDGAACWRNAGRPTGAATTPASFTFCHAFGYAGGLIGR